VALMSPWKGQNMPKVNEPEILDLQAWLREQNKLSVNEREWQQSVYVVGELAMDCGSRFCAAGRTVVRAGQKLVRPGSNMLVSYEGAEDAVEYAISDDEVVWAVSIHDRARQILGLTEREASFLFMGSNTAADMDEWIGEILDRAEREQRRDRA
jgi:hypothetical protein